MPLASSFSKFGTNGNLVQIDSNTVMRAHALRTARPSIPLFIQTLLPKNIPHFSSLSQNVLCIDGFKLGLMAQNCLAPGFLSFFYTLTNSVPDSTCEKARRVLGSAGNGGNNNGSSWIDEYADGLAMEIYTITLSSLGFKGISFQTLATLVYSKFNALVFALETASSSSITATVNTASLGADALFVMSGEIVLNPSEYVMVGTESVFVITRDQGIADEIGRGEWLDADMDGGAGGSDSVHLRLDEDVEGVGELVEEQEDEEGFDGESDPLLQSHGHDRDGGAGAGCEDRCEISGSSLDNLLYRGPKLSSNFLGSNFTLSGGHVTSTLITSSSLEFTGHVLICNLSSTFPANLGYFIAPFRAKDQSTPIVILSDGDPPSSSSQDLDNDIGALDTEDWSWLLLFGNVHHVRGSPLKRTDLARACCSSISRGVILCDPFQG